MKTILESHAKLLSGQLPKGTRLVVIAANETTVSVAAVVRNTDDIYLLLLAAMAKLTAESDSVDKAIADAKTRLEGMN
jgi:hypothetical protein